MRSVDIHGDGPLEGPILLRRDRQAFAPPLLHVYCAKQISPLTPAWTTNGLKVITLPAK